MTDNLYWLWLSMNCRAAAATLLLDAFSHPHAVYTATKEQIEAVLGNRYAKEKMLLSNKDLTGAHALMDACFLSDIGVLPYGSPDYPPLLRQIADPPVVLYYRGKLMNLDKELCISVVGTRDMTDYGEKAAFDIARDLATAGAVVVSGLALGIDGVASAAALSAGGKTIAVLGSGVDRIYPREHEKLYREIMQSGMILSEYPPGSPPSRHHFPERNRIISGLSQATLLVEGAENSGAMITARDALGQGRRVFAVPGNIDTPTSFSSNYLIQNGARAVTAADDILDAFQATHATRIHMDRLLRRSRVNRKNVLVSYGIAKRGASGFSLFGKKLPLFMGKEAQTATVASPDFVPSLKEESLMTYEPQSNEKKASPEPKAHAEDLHRIASEEKASRMDPASKAVYLSLINGSLTPDEIAEKTDLPVQKILTVLTVLEIGGDVAALAGNRYKMI